jgi:hypothetical protein
VLADRVGRTADWLSKVEHCLIPVDRLPVIKSLADPLEVSLGDLLAEPSLMEWMADTGPRTVPRLRDALMDYRQITRLFGSQEPVEPHVSPLFRAIADVGHSPNADLLSVYGTLFLTGRNGRRPQRGSRHGPDLPRRS